MRKVELGKLFGRKADGFRFRCGKFHRLADMNSFDLSTEHPLDWVIGGILQIGAEAERCGLVIGAELRAYKRMAYRDIRAGGEVHILPQPHVLVGWSWVPIYPCNR